MSHAPYYDPGSANVFFWVSVDDVPVGASIGKATLHYRYHPHSGTDDPLSTYTQHAAEIDAAVRTRLAAGAREPVMLRDPDISAPR
ncbi:MAG: DUF1488 family protein [Burkholderiales bacterium]|nr:MAG: DUF1488 family protein [Burkholderiales bacterium]